MLTSLFKKVFGSKNERELKRLKKIVKQINALEPDFEALADQELKAKTAIFRERLEQGETLENLSPESFATVR